MAKSKADDYKGSGLSKGAYLTSQKYKANAQDVYSSKNLKSSIMGIAAGSHNDPGDSARAVAGALLLAEEETGRTFLF